MKSKYDMRAGLKGHLAFALACLLLAGAGWAAKLSLDGLDAVQDAFEYDLVRGSVVSSSVHSVHQRQPHPTPQPVTSASETDDGQRRALP
jgi:hypothetical protein